MPKSIRCSHCNRTIEVTGDPAECHVCRSGHILCEKCNDLARAYCFRCGERTIRKVPNLEMTMPQDPEQIKQFLEQSCENAIKNFMQSYGIKSHRWDRSNAVIQDDTIATIIGVGKKPSISSIIHRIDDATEDRISLAETTEQQEENSSEKTDNAQMPAENERSIRKTSKKIQLPNEILECPITECRFPMYCDDATEHFLRFHLKAPIKMLPRQRLQHFKLNAANVARNKIKPLMRILVPGIVKNLGVTKHKNCLPLLLLYTRINTLEAYQNMKCEKEEMATMFQSQKKAFSKCNPSVSDKNEDVFLLWCAGVVPLHHPITVKLAIQPFQCPSKKIEKTTKVLPLDVFQNCYDIYRSEACLKISQNEIAEWVKQKSIIEGKINIL